MFYEDYRVGQTADLGTRTFGREGILAFGQAYDPRVLERAETNARRADATRLAASGLHVACEAMRAIIDWRNGVQREKSARAELPPRFGLSPGLKALRWPNPVFEGDVVAFTMTTVGLRETKKPHLGLLTNEIRGVNQDGVETLSFTSVVLVARRNL
jgi:acyl dehydratase